METGFELILKNIAKYISLTPTEVEFFTALLTIKKRMIFS
jgi:hypothetical protein